MMKRLNCLGIVCLLLLLAGLGPGARRVLADSATSGNFTYTYTSGESTCTIASYSGSGAVEIPEKFGVYTVTAIGDNAFKDNKAITSITFAGSGVTSIGEKAFYGCTGLTTVNLSKVTSLGKDAFNGCSSLASITALSSGLTTINENTFWGCSNLPSINLSNVASVGTNAFRGCSNLASVTAPSLTSVGMYAFYDCTNLASVDLPNVTSVGTYAFNNCPKLVSVDLPNVTSVGSNAFRFCTGLSSFTAPKLTSVESCVFQGCIKLPSINLSNVTSVWEAAFQDCTVLSSFTAPNLTSVRGSAFLRCKGLTSIDLSNVTSVGECAFQDCIGLTSIDLSSVNTLGSSAFDGCSNLAKAYFGGAVPSLGSNIFSGTGTGTADGFAVYCTKSYQSAFASSALGSYPIKLYKLKVTYDANGGDSGSVPTDSQLYDQDTQVTVLDKTGVLTNGAFLFRGWNTTAAGNGTYYSVGSKLPIAADTTLYAYWGLRFSAVMPTALKAGTAISVTSNNTGTVYLVPHSSYADENALKAATAKVTAAVTAGTATTVATTGLVEGTYYLYGVDSFGILSDPVTITIDNTGPSLGGFVPTVLKAGTAISVSSSEVGVVYLVPDGTYTTQAQLIAAQKAIVTISTANTEFSLTTPDNLAEGSYQVYAVDSVGNLSKSMTFTVDNTAPILSGVTPTLLKAGTAISASSSEVGVVCLISDGTNSLVKTVEVTAANPTVSLATTGLAEGTYRVYAVDRADNASAPVTVTIDNTAPTITLSAPSAASTAGGSVTYTVTYSGADSITLANSDITLNKTGTANGTVTVSGSDTTTRTVTISSISGDGTLGITIGAGTASDSAGNSAAAPAAGTTFTVDNTGPTVTLSAPSATRTAGGSVTYTVTYSGADSITLANNDVTLNKTGTANGTVAVSGSGTTTRTVIISSISGDGTLGITLAANTASDSVGNITAASAASTTFTVDNTAPTVTLSAPSATSTSSGSVTYTVTYSGADNITLSSSNVTLNKTGTATGTVAVSGTGTTTRTVTIGSISGDGTLGITLAASTASDSVGNTAAAPAASTTFTVDNTKPAVNTVSVSDANKTYTVGNTMRFTVNFSEAVTVTGAPTLGLTIGSTTVAATYQSQSNFGTQAVFEYTVAPGNIDSDGITIGEIALNGGSIVDSVGNTANLTLNSVADTSGVLVLTTVVSKDSVSDIAITGNVLTFTLDSIYYDYIQILTNGTVYQTIGNDDTDTEITSIGQQVNLTTESGAYSVVIRVYDLVGNYRDFATVYKVRVKYVPGRGDGFGWEMWKN